MNIEIDLPEDVAHALEKKWGDLSKYAAPILAVEGYRSGLLTAEQLHRVLSISGRFELEAFLEEHGIRSLSRARVSPQKRS